MDKHKIESARRIAKAIHAAERRSRSRLVIEVLSKVVAVVVIIGIWEAGKHYAQTGAPDVVPVSARCVGVEQPAHSVESKTDLFD